MPQGAQSVPNSAGGPQPHERSQRTCFCVLQFDGLGANHTASHRPGWLPRALASPVRGAKSVPVSAYHAGEETAGRRHDRGVAIPFEI